MEILKKAPIMLLVCLFLNGYAQTPLQKAFAASYTQEYQGKYLEAIASLNAVYDASSYETNLRLGWLSYLAGKFAESVTFYQRASGIMPAATEPMWGLVNPLSKLEKWTDIEKVYGDILKLDPKNATAHYRMGLIYYYRKDYPSAKKYFDTSLGLYPFDHDNMLMSGWTLYYMGKKEEAKAMFNRVLLYSPTDTSAMQGLSLLK